ncbi:uncharacterized protein TNCV_4409681 [Trichonephila clavipes]|nr:uncharacterized protein TNCV_4409681 [Trichonephila clavipes]
MSVEVSASAVEKNFCTLNSRRVASPLVRLVEGEERWEAPDHPEGVIPLNWGETELNRSVPCMVLKATANDRRHLALSHEEFRGPRSDFCRSAGIGNNNNRIFVFLNFANCHSFFRYAYSLADATVAGRH